MASGRLPAVPLNLDELPADAAVREAWEETGLVVRPHRLLGAYGGPHCVVQYPNGDETQYVIIAIGCTVIGGTATADQDETLELRYCSEPEAARLNLTPWLRAHLRVVYAGDDGPGFEPSKWRP